MGYPIGNYRCSACHFSEPGGISRIPRAYQLADGSYLDLRQIRIWCVDCAGLRNAENISLPNVLDELRQAARSLSSASRKRTLFGTRWSWLARRLLDDESDAPKPLTPEKLRELGGQIDEIQRRIGYLAARREPARCLVCGGQRLLHTEFMDRGSLRGVEHPGCGGVLFFNIRGSVNFAPIERRHVHGPDGTYSHDEPYSPAPCAAPWASKALD